MFDLAIVGAGTAGSALALHAARAGMRVIGLDRRPLHSAGARWVNGVPRWMFREADVDEPAQEELRGAGEPFHLLAGFGPTRVVVREHDVLDVDMRLLVARLQREAVEQGADLRGDVRVLGLSASGLLTSVGDVPARYVADASGLVGARLLRLPRAAACDLCAAAQQVRRVRDARGARAFLSRHDLEPGATLSFSAVAGGFSVINVRVEGETVSLLTGSLPALGHPGGSELLARFVVQEPWIGEPLFGGARAIPLAAPTILARGHVALLGDAGGQVFAAHGSGIGMGLIAARELAAALVRGDGPEGYARAFRARWATLLRASHWMRRASQELQPRHVAWMMRAGLIRESTVRRALEQRPVFSARHAS